MRSISVGEDLDRAYASCAEITRSQAKNFWYGIALLPAGKRRAMTAVYALARRIDDIGDGDAAPAVKLRLLCDIRHDVRGLAAAAVDRADPVLTALADAARRLPIPVAAFEEVIDGCSADVEGRAYRTVDDLIWYCRCVAGAVGRLSVGVYDPADLGAALPLADRLGLALQLTNILRDLREDRLTGRIYLPAEDLHRFDCRLDLDAEGGLSDPPDAFDRLVRFEAERAMRWYAEGLALLPLLDRRSAACTAAMAGIYRQLLDRIAERPDRVRAGRQSLTAPAKLRVAVHALTRPRG